MMKQGQEFDVIVCGSLHLDIMVHSPHLPRLDETAVGTAWGMVCGGKGGNQAVMSARMGARTAMISRVGDDAFGLQLTSNLASNGVDISEISMDETRGSGMSVAILQPDGNYGAVIVSGANQGLRAEGSRRSLKNLASAKVLVLQNEIPGGVNAAIAAAAFGRAHVILNAAPARAMEANLYDHIDTLVVNRVEAEMVSGRPVSDMDSAVAALPALGSGRRNVIVTLGGEGLVLQARGGEPIRIKAHPVTVVSSHGAGDCFIGALACRLALGQTLVEAARFASHAAATYVSLKEADRNQFTAGSVAP